MFSKNIVTLATKVLEQARQKGVMIATAESCTGGLVSASLTEIAGSSDVFDRGFATYSNEAKHEMIGVDAELIKAKGAVSADVAKAMAKGVIKHSNAQMSVTTTGIAGPGGATKDKPVGLVHFGLSFQGDIQHDKYIFDGNRAQVREQAVEHALNMLLKALS